MTISKEVSDAVDQIRRDKDLISSMRAADEVRDQQAAAAQEKIHSLEAGAPLSAEDKQALVDAVSGMRDVNGALTGAVLANVDQPNPVDTPPETQIRDVPRSDDGKALPIAAPVADAPPAPLMPNMAFDPTAGNAGHPDHVPSVETPGGFVVAGGGSVSRAVGSLPESPSSTVAVPADPEAKAPGGPAVVGPDGVATAIPPGGEASADPAKVDPDRMAAPNAPFGEQAGIPPNVDSGAPVTSPAPDATAPASPVADPPGAPIPSSPPPSQEPKPTPVPAL